MLSLFLTLILVAYFTKSLGIELRADRFYHQRVCPDHGVYFMLESALYALRTMIRKVLILYNQNQNQPKFNQNKSSPKMIFMKHWKYLNLISIKMDGFIKILENLVVYQVNL